MTYFEGFVAAVPEANKDAYREHANKVAPLLEQCGIRRMVEGWADDVPHGKVTDFHRAVEAHPGETIVFSFFEYSSKKERDSANQKFASDPRLQELGKDVPFDARRMIFGGFDSLVEAGSEPGTYINGFIVPIRRDQKDAYRQLTGSQAAIFREYGALRLVQACGDDVPHGTITDFYRAVQAEPEETVVFAFIEWPSKQASLEAWEKIMKDERMQPSSEAPFDGKRMFWGGFDVILDTAKTTAVLEPVQVQAAENR
ncbi:MAG TPA: DUF1428 domain-containing protein [Sphingomicrobium sp.]|nr:DUF1428 domain-containing protein [Sphingomicrobium sp.]